MCKCTQHTHKHVQSTSVIIPAEWKQPFHLFSFIGPVHPIFLKLRLFLTRFCIMSSSCSASPRFSSLLFSLSVPLLILFILRPPVIFHFSIFTSLYLGNTSQTLFSHLQLLSCHDHLPCSFSFTHLSWWERKLNSTTLHTPAAVMFCCCCCCSYHDLDMSGLLRSLPLTHRPIQSDTPWHDNNGTRSWDSTGVDKHNIIFRLNGK